MKTILKVPQFGIFLSLLFLCSCATERPARLPAAVQMNKGAGRGDELFVTLHFENGEKLPFFVDTGTSGVLLDKSLEPKLGRCFWTHRMHEWYGIKTLKLYRAPKLYLGNSQLRTSGWVWTADFSTFSNVLATATHTNRPIMGVLGMSCLKHYCLQLDFAANKLRFLDDAHSDKRDWGKAFPLFTHSYAYGGCFFIRKNLVGIKGQDSEVDTGCDFDGYLTPKLFCDWTNHMKAPPNDQVYFPNGTLGGDIYTNVYLNGDGSCNGIGLQVLARNLVTFDFPNRVMYLKQTSAGPLIDEDTSAALDFLTTLKKRNELPGWTKNDKGEISASAYPVSEIFDAWKNGRSTIYHYAVVWDIKDESWKLQRAWQTGKNGEMVEEYSIP